MRPGPSTAPVCHSVSCDLAMHIFAAIRPAPTLRTHNLLLCHFHKYPAVHQVHCSSGAFLPRIPVVTTRLLHAPRVVAEHPPDATDVATGPQAPDSPSLSPEFDNSSQDAEDEEEVFPQIKLSLPPPTHTKVKSAEYIRSSVKHQDCPPPKLPEFAVIGRSNVGKSSLINMLTNSKNLAHVSKEPGKTRCINHFLINKTWYLVDLPGYGYAKQKKETREMFEQFTKDYLRERANLAMVFLLIDASIPPQKVDLEYAGWLSDNEVPFTIVFTKTDKRKKRVPKKDDNMYTFKKALMETFEYLPPTLVTSSMDGTGKGPLLHFIGSIRVAVEKSGKAWQRSGAHGSSGSSGGAHGHVDEDEDEDE